MKVFHLKSLGGIQKKSPVKKIDFSNLSIYSQNDFSADMWDFSADMCEFYVLYVVCN